MGGRWGGEKGKEEENLSCWEGYIVEKIKRESKERDILMEGAIMGLVRNLVLGKIPGIHKDDLN